MDRRNFFKTISAGGAIFAAAPAIKAIESTKGLLPDSLPETNMDKILSIPRTKNSLPGKYPGKVVVCKDEDCIIDNIPSEEAAYQMISASMLTLTGKKNLKKAWREFVSPKDVIGLKVNPIGDALLSTSHAVTKSVIRQLEESGIPRKNIIIWDRREENLINAGYTAQNYPGIEILSTEYVDSKGSMYDEKGELYSKDRINKDVFLYADVDGEYDAYTLPYMVNEGKYSYMTKIVTDRVTKIINLPILKNAGPTVTLCLKNLAFGSITNTGRLHKPLWHQTCAYVCAFPQIRDKVVLNIVDGMKGCFDGGPGANPQFICNYNVIMAGTDPVSVDRIGHEIVIKKRIEEGVQKEDNSKNYKFATIAENLELGIANRDKIELINI
jgi:hypothetical protein